MPRCFNTAGPCRPDDHYMLPAQRRIPDVRRLVDRKAYFVVHAARQTGKTTSLLSLAHDLTAEGRYAAVLVSMIVGADRPAAAADDLGAVENAVLYTWRETAQHQLPRELCPPPWPDAPPGSRLRAALAAWARAIPRTLVVFLDEFDAPRGDLLVSALHQLQEGYRDRPKAFPWSMALIGLRDTRDDRIDAADPNRRGVPSPFNILVSSLSLRDFTAEEIAELYQQHTAETGQRFEPEAIRRAFASPHSWRSGGSTASHCSRPRPTPRSRRTWC